MLYSTFLCQPIKCVSGLVTTNKKGGVEGGVEGGVALLKRWRRVAQKTTTHTWRGFQPVA